MKAPTLNEVGEKLMRYFFNKRHASWRMLLSGLFVAVFFLGAFHPVQAYADTGRDVVSQQSVSIPRGEIAEDVLVFGNNATISGTVTGTLVVISGNIHLNSTARTDIVIDLGGHLTQDPGAHANAVYTLAFSQPFINSITVGSALVVAIWAMRLALSAALVAFPVVLALIFRSRLEHPVSYLERSVRRAGLTGILTSVIFIALSVITAITIIGLPVTAIMLLVYAIIGLVGFTCISVWLGRVTNFGGIQERPIWLQTLIGATFVMAFGNIPLVGPILLIIAWLAGVGAVTTWIWQGWQSRKRRPTAPRT